MKRRTLMSLSVGGAAALALVGGSLAWLRPARQQTRLTAPTRTMMAAVARGVLHDSLPLQPQARAQALQAHLDRLESTIAGMPPAMQAEVDQLLSLLVTAPGRLALTGLVEDWSAASDAQLAQALQTLRDSRLALRQQAYHALRDLSNAAYFAGPETWQMLGYPGPLAV